MDITKLNQLLDKVSLQYPSEFSFGEYFNESCGWDFEKYPEKSTLNDLAKELPNDKKEDFEKIIIDYTKNIQAYNELNRKYQEVIIEQPVLNVASSGDIRKWKGLQDEALKLLEKSRNTRLIIILLNSLVFTDGLSGLAEGLSLLNDILERFWDSVFPSLDNESNNDPTARINSLGELWLKNTALQKSIVLIPLVQSKVGSFNLRDIHIAKGILKTLQETDVPDISIIKAAFISAEQEKLHETSRLVEKCISHLNSIDSVLTENATSHHAPNLDTFSRLLKDIQQAMKEFMVNEPENKNLVQNGNNALTVENDIVIPKVNESIPSASMGNTGIIKNRQDVILTIDLLCKFYSDVEPSSPIPLLLQRAKSLVSKNYREILMDLSADGLGQLEFMSGKSNNDKE